jgi:hypothetical protein
MPEQKEEMFDEDELLHSGCGHVWSSAYGKTLCKRISRIRDLFAEHCGHRRKNDSLTA